MRAADDAAGLQNTDRLTSQSRLRSAARKRQWTLFLWANAEVPCQKVTHPYNVCVP